MEFPRDLDEQRRVMYEAQLRTNELLEQLIQLQTKPTVVKTINPPINKAPQVKSTKPQGRQKR